MDYDRKDTIWHPDDAKGMEGQTVLAFDSWDDSPTKGTYTGKSGDHDYPFHVEFTAGLSSDYAIIIPNKEPFNDTLLNNMLDRLFYSDTAKEKENSEVLLYIFLLWMAQKENPVFIGHNDIKDYIKISDATITIGVHDMAALGMIEIIKGEKNAPNGYLVKDVRL